MPSPTAKKIKVNSPLLRLASLLTAVGVIFIASAILILVFTFWPVIKVELGYQLTAKKIIPLDKKLLIPVDPNFDIIIPKIGANARVIPNVDPFDSRAYQAALTRGVAQARGTVLPGMVGNSFLFSHSSTNFYEAARYNSVFYLLAKLEKGDEIEIFLAGKKLVFTVSEKKLVEPSAVTYLTGQTDKKLLTLMTCWPPGTTIKRLLVIGELKEGI